MVRRSWEVTSDCRDAAPKALSSAPKALCTWPSACLLTLCSSCAADSASCLLLRPAPSPNFRDHMLHWALYSEHVPCKHQQRACTTQLPTRDVPISQLPWLACHQSAALQCPEVKAKMLPAANNQPRLPSSLLCRLSSLPCIACLMQAWLPDASLFWPLLLCSRYLMVEADVGSLARRQTQSTVHTRLPHEATGKPLHASRDWPCNREGQANEGFWTPPPYLSRR